MATITKTEEFGSPPEDVWAKITDFSGYGDWMTIHDDYPDGPPESIEPEQTFREKVKIMGMPGEVTWTVKQVQEPSLLSLEGAGPMGTTLSATYKLESDANGGTKLTYETEFGGAALAAMAKPLENASEKAANDSMENLKGLLS